MLYEPYFSFLNLDIFVGFVFSCHVHGSKVTARFVTLTISDSKD